MRGRFRTRQMRAARHPLAVGLEPQSKPVVGNAHIAVGAARYRFRRKLGHIPLRRTDGQSVKLLLVASGNQRLSDRR